MAIFKCKMCGGQLEFEEGASVCECEYCGSKQTISTANDEKIVKLYDRANRLRMSNEFDKATGVYESIISELDTEAEAYWGLLLCKYGIEYVDDPASGNKIPTCHRVSFDSIMDDSDFELVMENSDTLSRTVYREQAKQIEDIRKRIIEVSSSEAPYDIFICYKESDENGERTVDSVMAQNIYDMLTQKGYRVFFSRISLEDKLGQEYEPFIFAALNSAKVMLAFGTTYDYYNAVWVKNEWSRYLKLMDKDKEKHLIPCYKDIDAYDMPGEFRHLQAQDMGKVGADQDLIRGIEKYIPLKSDNEGPVQSANTISTEDINAAIASALSAKGGNNVTALIQRGNMALEDGEWEKADGFFEEALNQDAKCADAYWGKFLASIETKNSKDAPSKYVSLYRKNSKEIFEACEENRDHIMKMNSEYAVKDYIFVLDIMKMYEYDRTYISYTNGLKEDKIQAIKSLSENKIYSRAKQYANFENENQINELESKVTVMFDELIETSISNDESAIASIVDSYAKHIKTKDKELKDIYDDVCIKREDKYKRAVELYESATNLMQYEEAKKALLEVEGYKDADEYINNCNSVISRISKSNESDILKVENKKKNKMRRVVILIAILVLLILINISAIKYFIAGIHMSNGNYKVAYEMYTELVPYKDSGAKASAAYRAYLHNN